MTFRAFSALKIYIFTYFTDKIEIGIQGYVTHLWNRHDPVRSPLIFQFIAREKVDVQLREGTTKGLTSHFEG